MTAVGVLVIIGGALELLFGLVYVTNADNVSTSVTSSSLTSSSVTIMGVSLLVLGLVAPLLAWGILQGKRWARTLLGVVATVRLVVAVIGIFAFWGAWPYWPASPLSALLAALVVYLLFIEESAAEFFAPRV